MQNGAEMLVEALRREKVDLIFGYPGGAVIPIFDALYNAPDIRIILNRHEQAAVHAADGYARSTGRTGVCIVTSGPGATNTVTGLATAKFDSVPLVCITGQVSRPMIGNDAFQEVDTVGITQPVTKHNFLVTERKSLGRILKQSFYLASTGRPGPVVVDIPKDVQLEFDDEAYPEAVMIRGYSPPTHAPAHDVALLAEAIASAKKPLFFVGGGVVISNAAAKFREIASSTGIPFVTSLMGIGVADTRHPLNLGMIGMHGSVIANKALTACDLLVGLGVRFDDRAVGDPRRFAPNATIAHVDIDPSSIGRNMRADIPVVGDLLCVLEDLAPLLEKVDISEWREEILRNKKSYVNFLANTEPAQNPAPGSGEKSSPSTGSSQDENSSRDKKLAPLPSPREALSIISEHFPDAIIATEVGQNQMWAAQYLKFNVPRHWLTSGGLGTMGYGFPAGLGAQAGNPASDVVIIAGDGSFQMNIQELATCVQENLPVIVVILNNGYLGMVRQWQELFFGRRYSSTCLQKGPECSAQCMPSTNCHPYQPDFAGIARAYGALGFVAETAPQLHDALSTARAMHRPTVIDCRIEREENVWPIVPPGKGNDEMLYKGVFV